ncbi:MAG: hypothetical protein GWP62_14180 [Gammaproteobacteria bacterium]|nr:hypothetical protein [Gammaproteobacteria bacterium]
MLRIAVAMTPWILSMYTLYWLEHGEIWTTETAHRGKISVTILLIGMVSSFLIMSYFAARQKQ